MKTEIEVNGITVEFDVNKELNATDTELYTLLRKGDECEVDDGGVKYKGIVENIIRLSKGKTLFSIRMLNNAFNDTAFYEGCQVTPANPIQCALRVNALDFALRKYEPKGKSTNTYSM